MHARIYQPTKTAMQSGKANTAKWVLDFDAETAKRIDPLMGWTGSGDMNGQVRMTFASKEEAVAYAKAHAIAFQVVDPQIRRPKPKAYADNFRTDRKGTWTH